MRKPVLWLSHCSLWDFVRTALPGGTRQETLQASGGWRSGTLLNTLPSTDLPLHRVPRFSSAAVRTHGLTSNFQKLPSARKMRHASIVFWSSLKNLTAQEGANVLRLSPSAHLTTGEPTMKSTSRAQYPKYFKSTSRQSLAQKAYQKYTEE